MRSWVIQGFQVRFHVKTDSKTSLGFIYESETKTSLGFGFKPNLKCSPISRHPINENHQKLLQFLNFVDHKFEASVDSVINIFWVAVRFC